MAFGTEGHTHQRFRPLIVSRCVGLFLNISRTRNGPARSENPYARGNGASNCHSQSGFRHWPTTTRSSANPVFKCADIGGRFAVGYRCMDSGCGSVLDGCGLLPQSAHIDSRMVVRLSRSVWVRWTGLGRATPLGGQARMRSHRPKSVGGWESAGHYQDSIQGCVSRLLGQTPTRFLCVLNYPSLLAVGQEVIHVTAMVHQTHMELPSAARLSNPTIRPGCATPPTSSHSNTPSRLWAGEFQDSSGSVGDNDEDDCSGD
jgi:hypothetical protein